MITPFTDAFKRSAIKASIPFAATMMALNARNVAFLQRMKEIWK